jgi:hypothetical protein
VFACDAVDRDSSAFDAAHLVSEIAHVLATEVSRSAAAELIAGIEALGHRAAVNCDLKPDNMTTGGMGDRERVVQQHHSAAITLR